MLRFLFCLFAEDTKKYIYTICEMLQAYEDTDIENLKYNYLSF
jgi:hypothetical protein